MFGQKWSNIRTIINHLIFGQALEKIFEQETSPPPPPKKKKKKEKKKLVPYAYAICSYILTTELFFFSLCRLGTTLSLQGKVMTAAFMGAPAVMLEKLSNGTETSRAMACVKDVLAANPEDVCRQAMPSGTWFKALSTFTALYVLWHRSSVARHRHEFMRSNKTSLRI